MADDTFGGEPLRNPKHHRCFARATDRQIADADYSTLKLPAAQEPALIKSCSQAHQTAVKHAQRAQ